MVEGAPLPVGPVDASMGRCGRAPGVLQWARGHGCPWNSYTCICATVYGQLEVLQWVRHNDANSAVWDERLVLRHADGPRKQEVLAWLDELSAP